MMDETLVRELKHRIASRFDYSQSMSDRELIEQIEEDVFEYAKQEPLTAARKKSLVHRLFHSFRGLDVLQPLLDDPGITEVMVNAHDEIFYERNGKIERYGAAFEDQAKLEDIIQAIVSKVNRTVNESQPIVDARLNDGSRVHVVLPPIALKGPALTIRRFPEKPMAMDDLLARGALTEEAAAFLERLVIAKYNIFISGGTGSGKTTFLNVLTRFIPPGERIVTIEDSAELQIRHIPNLVSLETRNANTEGKGEIPMRDLIRASLRMRPNRIIVGEVRGAEALDMLQAMNTGHDGSLSTGHANSTRDMLSRLETMVLAGAPLPVDVIRKQTASALDILVHLSRLRDGTRRVMEISEVAGMKNGEIELNPLYRFVEEPGSRVDGLTEGMLQPTGNQLAGTWKWTMSGFESLEAGSERR